MRVRVTIDSLIEGAKASIQGKYLSESMEQLEQARGLVQELKQRSTSDQADIVAKRETIIANLTINAGKIKKPVIKEPRASGL